LDRKRRVIATENLGLLRRTGSDVSAGPVASRCHWPVPATSFFFRATCRHTDQNNLTQLKKHMHTCPDEELGETYKKFPSVKGHDAQALEKLLSQ
jgi:hypothetical protein